MKKLNVTREFLENEYYKNKKSLVQIAKELNCNSCSLTRYMKKYNLKHCSHKKIFYCIKNCGKKVSRNGNRCTKCWGKEFSLKQKKENNTCFRHGKYIKGTLYYCIQKNCKNKVSRPDISCISCSNKINMKKWWNNVNNKKRIITKRIKDGTFKLENNPNWKGGKSFEPYPLGWTKTFKEQIRKRDGYICQYCKITQEEHLKKHNKRLFIHHIDYDKNNLDVNNLIALCNKCHTKTNFNRNNWKCYFIKFMEKK